jgi:hypothetical protein
MNELLKIALMISLVLTVYAASWVPDIVAAHHEGMRLSAYLDRQKEIAKAEAE